MKSISFILRKGMVAVLICVAILVASSPLAYAATPHEDPNVAKLVYSGLSLLRYYSESLDFVLIKNAAETETRLGKMPFANIPESLNGPTADFSTHGISVSYLIVSIYSDLGDMRQFSEQGRLDKAITVYAGISLNLARAYTEVEKLESAAEATGKEIQVENAPPDSQLSQTYNEVLEKIRRIKEMLDLYRNLLSGSILSFASVGRTLPSGEVENLTSQLETVTGQLKALGITAENQALIDQLLALIQSLKGTTVSPEDTQKIAEQIENLTQKLNEQNVSPETQLLIEQLRKLILDLKRKTLSPEETEKLGQDLETINQKLKALGITIDFPDILTRMLLRPTTITLNINTEAAFVGDDIRFDGRLTSEGEPLAGKQVNIILNGSPYATTVTGADGHFNGMLTVPYWYITEMELQALYSPRDKEASIYLSSISPVIKLGVLFYEAKLEITVEGKAYPGLETTITGKYDYGTNPPLSERTTEIYLDGVFITGGKQPESFKKKIQLNPQIEVGEHNITASAAADKRYAPVVAEMILPVTLAIPVLEINVPGLAVIPGSLDIAGRLYSELSPVNGASVKMTLAGSQNEFVCSENGTFNNELKMGMGFSIIGSQELKITVIPQEPWYAPLVATRRLVIINPINCGIILAILMLLCVYLPGKLRRRLEIQPGRAAAVEIPAILPEPVPTHSDTANALVKIVETIEAYIEPRRQILHWYRLALHHIQRITNSLLKPQQTLREFADETGRLLGPAAKYFFQFTLMVERLLYSPYVATTGDVQTVRHLSSQIGAESGTNNNVQSVASPTRDATKTGISTVSDEIPIPNAGVVAASTRQELKVDNNKQRSSSPTRDTTETVISIVPDETPLPDARSVPASHESRADNIKRLSTWLLALLILAVIYFAFLAFMVAVRVASR